MSSEWVAHFDIITEVLESVEPADLSSAHNLGAAVGYIMAIRNLFVDLENAQA